MFGQTKFESWVNDGLITIRKDVDQSAPWRIDRLQIEPLAKSAVIFKFS